jgi:hypothetical protein
MPHPDSSAALFWQRRASRLARKVNLHHVLDRAVPGLFFLFVFLALFELLRRDAGWPLRWTESLFLLGFALVAGWAWLQARRHFCSREQALVRIESALGLHNRLSAAQAGVVSWPKPTVFVGDGYVENWKWLLTPLLAGIAFLWAAHLVPIIAQARAAGIAGQIAPPAEFAQVQAWIDALKAEDLIEPEKLQDMESALDKLRDQQARDWYTQGNLEAANALKELMAQSMNGLSRDLEQADRTVQAMRDQAAAPGNGASLQPMQDELRKSADNLASGNLPLKRELVDQMRGGESAQDKTLSPDQLKALQDRLKKGELAAQTAPKSNGGLSDEMKQAMNDAAKGEGTRRGFAPGGKGGGGGPAPLELQPRDKNSVAGKLTSVNNDDMSRAALGETLRISAGEHMVDPSAYHGTQSAGAAQVRGSGGEAVWRSTYDPQEADTLSQFFK